MVILIFHGKLKKGQKDNES